MLGRLPALLRNWRENLGPGRGRYSIFLALMLFVAIVVKNLWITDDAAITFRTVDNVVHGYGLTWNTDERVQSYTHPLWMFLLSATNLVIHNVYHAALVLCVLCTLAAAYVFAFRVTASRLWSVCGLVALSTSKAFVDFSTSGLENPLTHLLLALFACVYLRHEQSPGSFVDFRSTRWQQQMRGYLSSASARFPGLGSLGHEERYVLALTVLAALAAFNRMDTILLYLPVLFVVYYRTFVRKARVQAGFGFRTLIRGVRLALIGFSPFILWEVFSLWYYGFPFPNTAYAKLDTGVSTVDYLINGVHYLWDSVRYFDPVLLLIPVGIVLPLFFRGRRSIPLAAGALLYLAYIMKIGGDFMAGRFLTAELLLALILLSRIPLPSLRTRAGIVAHGALALATVLCVLAGVYVVNATLYPITVAPSIRYYHVVADERSFWGGVMDIQSIIHRRPIPTIPEAESARLQGKSGRAFVLAGSVGFFGVEAGPNVHVQDGFVLNDPLLARLPARSGWLIGHFRRDMPAGYLETVQTGRNQIQDPDLAAYYDKLSLITRGNLFDMGRLATIVRMNLGQYDYLLRAYNQRQAASDAAPQIHGGTDYGGNRPAPGTSFAPFAEVVRPTSAKRYAAPLKGAVSSRSSATDGALDAAPACGVAPASPHARGDSGAGPCSSQVERPIRGHLARGPRY